MQVTIEHAGVAGQSKIHVAHGKEVLEFDAAVYQQAFKKGTYEPFQQINKWWLRIDADRQDKIFDLFKEAKLVMNRLHNVEALILELRPIVHELIGLHDTKEFEHWAQRHGGIWIPEELDKEYHYNYEKPSSREQTYLVTDYWELVFMVLKLRVLAPIWGEFVEKTKRQSGMIFRDLNAYWLISKSDLVQGDAMVRLKNYIDKNVKQEDINIRSSIDGIGSDLYPTNLLANVLVRFLVVASLTREPSDTHIVQVVHKTLRNRLSQNDSHQNLVLEKQNPNEEDSSEDSSSRAEKYKNKPLVPPGTIVAINKYTEYVNQIAARLLLKDVLDEEEQKELEVAMKASDKMSHDVFEDCQIRLIQWVCSPIIPPRALLDINKASVMRLAGITQYVLWKTGFKEVAAFATAKSMNAEGMGSYAPEIRSHMPKHLVDKLNELFPFYRRHPLKKQLKPNNEAVNEIVKIGQEIVGHTWFLNMDDEQVAELRGSAANKTYRVGYDIRVKLAELVIYLQQRNKEFLSLYNFENIAP